MNPRWILLALIVVGCVFLSGCAWQGAEVGALCKKPYIKMGTGCCLDQNNNSICDNDEGGSSMAPATSTTTDTSTSAPTATTQKTYIVMATGTRIDADRIMIAYEGGPDSDQLNSMSVTVTNTKTGAICSISTLSPTVGSSVFAECSGATHDDRLQITVTATFEDGTRQMILNTSV